MKRLLTYLLLQIVIISATLGQSAPIPTPEFQAKVDSIPELILSSASENTTLPYKKDNATKIWMRSIFNQQGNSCAQSAGVGYTFTYEIDRLRNVAASNNETRYPVDFTYNFLNQGTDLGSWEVDGWKIIQEGGCPNINTYEPGGDGFVEKEKWMNGYNNYYDGITNRVDDYKVIELWTNFEDLKHWINDHGNGEDSGGIATFTANTSFNEIELSTVPGDSEEGGGLGIVDDWGHPEDEFHTMTIVGYNDKIMYPLNNDGVYRNDYDNNGDGTIDKRDWEIGAVKVANSWGSGWQGSNGGYIYVPYRLLFDLGVSYYNSVVNIVYANIEYEPEIVLKVEMENNERNQFKTKAGYAENAGESSYEGYDTYFAFTRKGGPFPMQGINYYPLEFALDYSYKFNNEDVGKVFLILDQIGHVDGTINNFSLVDYRWNEEIEVDCDPSILPMPTAYGANILSINYDVLPFNINPLDENPKSINTDVVVRKQTVIKSGMIVNIGNNVQFDFYNSQLIIEEGATVNVGNWVSFYDKTGGSSLIVDGDINFTGPVRFIGADAEPFYISFSNGNDDIQLNGGKLENVNMYNGTNSLSINNFDPIKNSVIDQGLSDVSVSYSNFENSKINAANYIMGPGLIDKTVSVDNCEFNSTDDELVAIYIHNYANFSITDNIIENYFNGIQLSVSGYGNAGNQNIHNNNISQSINAAISIYSTISSLTENYLHENEFGITIYDHSNVAIYGDCNASSNNDVNYIKDNDSYEVYASAGSFPWYFRYNKVEDLDNGGNDEIPPDPLIYYDYPSGHYDLDARFNCWDANFLEDDDLYPEGAYVEIGEDTWCPGDGCNKSSEIALQTLKNGLAYFEGEQYDDAKTTFKSVIDLYPKTQYAATAMKELFALEKVADNNYGALKQYYGTNDSIQADSVLTKLAVFLSNKCEIEMENWQTAIDHFEDIIEDPDTPQDSIFAIIDLGHTYLLIGDSGFKSTYQGRMPELIPESTEEFIENSNYLLSLLPFTKQNNEVDKHPAGQTKSGELLQNIPNPFSNITTIQFNLNIKDIVSAEIRVYNHLGKVVRQINLESTKEGRNDVDLNMSDLPSGVYLYSLFINGKQADTKKMVLARN